MYLHTSSQSLSPTHPAMIRAATEGKVREALHWEKVVIFGLAIDLTGSCFSSQNHDPISTNSVRRMISCHLENV